jgi:hypothetical protein
MCGLTTKSRQSSLPSGNGTEDDYENSSMMNLNFAKILSAKAPLTPPFPPNPEERTRVSNCFSCQEKND